MAAQMAEGASVDVLMVKAAQSLGYSDLKREQKVVIKAFVEGKDVFVTLPTGYGKSLCYALLPWIFDMRRGLAEKTSICMIVSPLIALMKDQSTSFTAKGISATYISDKEATNKGTKRKIVKGEYQLVFISPEALFLATEWRRMLAGDYYRKHLVGFIVDEAHCVKKW
jgi:ATP-dependent DNA helicase RecQ